MNICDIIAKKRDGRELDAAEIEYFINGFTSGSIPDYQASAFLMAIYLKGMTDRETADLTMAMAKSGETLDLSEFGTNTVDKHSTGGVGDKTTLIVAPIAAALGCDVAKMSGRGLGFTGGTADKLSSIPGYRISLERDELISLVRKTGVSVITQSDDLTPADKKLYALRDVTATVESIPLIASSIMSKKIAAGCTNIVLDVKYGSGAFMKTYDNARLLAKIMVNVGKNCGKKTVAVITGMETPLGSAVGNILEVKEAISVLGGADVPDLTEECIVLAAHMVSLAKDIPVSEAEELSVRALKSGAAFDKFKQWIKEQGGDTEYIDDPDKFPSAGYSAAVLAKQSGYIVKTDTESIGKCASILGAGRQKTDDTVDHTAGIVFDKKAGDHVESGERICTLYTNNGDILPAASDMLYGALEFGREKPPKNDIIRSVIT
ncbi:MAG: pyrimidine-nucleoside phosphorylase [Clostridia bacterium]|nr:pyrimidine-nucleoside phosphorylase [Clostridia bacterium]